MRSIIVFNKPHLILGSDNIRTMITQSTSGFNNVLPVFPSRLSKGEVVIADDF